MDIEKLIEKYKAGETSLEEEQFLMENVSDFATDVSAWLRYANQSKKQSSPDLKNNIWTSINKKILRFRMGLFAAAASIFLVAIFSISNMKEKEMAYEEKAAVLKEAMAMLSDVETLPAAENIIYEDDLVIIYTSTE